MDGTEVNLGEAGGRLAIGFYDPAQFVFQRLEPSIGTMEIKVV